MKANEKVLILFLRFLFSPFSPPSFRSSKREDDAMTEPPDEEDEGAGDGDGELERVGKGAIARAEGGGVNEVKEDGRPVSFRSSFPPLVAWSARRDATLVVVDRSAKSLLTDTDLL